MILTDEFKYLDKCKALESKLHDFISFKNCQITMLKYESNGGYGTYSRIFFCDNSYYEHYGIIRQIWNESKNLWVEEYMAFDYNEFHLLKSLIGLDLDNGITHKKQVVFQS